MDVIGVEHHRAGSPVGVTSCVRSANLSDRDWIVSGLYDLMLRASEHSTLPEWNEPFIRTRLIDLIDNHLLLIHEDESGSRTGFLCGLITRHYLYPSVLTLTELVFWVDHAYGLGAKRAATRLLDFYTNWGRENCDAVIFTLTKFCNISPRSLVRRGYRQSESSFVLEVA